MVNYAILVMWGEHLKKIPTLMIIFLLILSATLISLVGNVSAGSLIYGSPTNVEPSGSGYNPGDIVFEWTAVSGCDRYVVEVADHQNIDTHGTDLNYLASPSYQSPYITGATSYTHASGTIGRTVGTWYWHVYGYNSGTTDYGQFSTITSYTIEESINVPPVLTSDNVSPSSGDSSTTFAYQVTYTDDDNDAPVTKNVYIDDNPHTMSKVSGSYDTGAVYQYSTTLSEGSHTYYFSFSDGNGGSDRLPTSGSYSGPGIVPTGLIYGSPTNIEPLGSGYNPGDIIFDWTAVSGCDRYVVEVADHQNIDTHGTDLNYFASPSYQSPYITGATSYTHASGTIGRTIGTWYWHVYGYNSATSDYGQFSTVTSYEIEDIINIPPELTSSSVTPTSGDSSTTFTYKVTYTDEDNDAPVTMNVFIDDNPHEMSKVSGSHDTGAVYQYSTTLLKGSHTYYFSFSDGNGGSDRLPISGSDTGPEVSPSGFIYGSPTNIAPDGSGYAPGNIVFEWTAVTGCDRYVVEIADHQNIDTHGTDLDYLASPSYQSPYITGATSYTHASGDIGRTINTWYWHVYGYNSATSDYGQFSSLTSYSISDVDIGVTKLESDSLTPTSGDESTIFTYQVTYTDEDNDAPIKMDVYIDGSPNEMSKISGTYTSGAIYEYSTTLIEGSHSYYFLFSDGSNTVRQPLSGSRAGPTVVPTLPDNDPPNPPKSIFPDTTTDTTPKITWSGASDPEGNLLEFRIQMGTSSQGDEIFSWISTGSATEYDIVTPLDFGAYFVQVKSYDGEFFSEVFEMKMTITEDTIVTTLETPTGLTVTPLPEGGALKLTWNAVTGSDFTGYHIYRDYYTDYVILDSVPKETTEYTDTNVEDKYVYFYKISSYIKGGDESPLSKEVSASPIKIDPKLTWAKKYSPKLYFHSNEKYFPTDVSALLDNYELETRKYLNDDFYYRIEDEFVGNYEGLQNNYEKTIYIRIVEYDKYETDINLEDLSLSEKQECITVQYWFFYIFNDFLNVHEGDWEVVECIWKGNDLNSIIDNNKHPDFVAFSQHNWVETLPWDDVEKEKENGLASHPVVYVALGSHANYPTEGTPFIVPGGEVTGIQTFEIEQLKNTLIWHIRDAIVDYLIKIDFSKEDAQYLADSAMITVGLLLTAEKILDFIDDVSGKALNEVIAVILGLIGEKVTDIAADGLKDILFLEIQLIIGQLTQLLGNDALESTEESREFEFNLYQYILLDGDETWLNMKGRWGCSKTTLEGYIQSNTITTGLIGLPDGGPFGPKFQYYKWDEPAAWGMNKRGIDVMATLFDIDFHIYLFGVRIFSPVDLHVYDEFGNHAGLNYSTETIDNNIQNGYFINNHPQTFVSLKKVAYRYELIGLDDDTYTMELFSIDESEKKNITMITNTTINSVDTINTDSELDNITIKSTDTKTYSFNIQYEGNESDMDDIAQSIQIEDLQTVSNSTTSYDMNWDNFESEDNDSVVDIDIDMDSDGETDISAEITKDSDVGKIIDQLTPEYDISIVEIKVEHSEDDELIEGNPTNITIVIQNDGNVKISYVFVQLFDNELDIYNDTISIQSGQTGKIIIEWIPESGDHELMAKVGIPWDEINIDDNELSINVTVKKGDDDSDEKDEKEEKSSEKDRTYLIPLITIIVIAILVLLFVFLPDKPAKSKDDKKEESDKKEVNTSDSKSEKKK